MCQTIGNTGEESPRAHKFTIDEFRFGIKQGWAITGNWPITITGSQDFNGSHCVALTGGYSSGGAILDSTYYGAFQVSNGTILVFLDITGSGEEPATLLFSSSTRKGKIGKGAFSFIQGGYSYDSCMEVFGTKGGC